MPKADWLTVENEHAQKAIDQMKKGLWRQFNRIFLNYHIRVDSLFFYIVCN